MEQITTRLKPDEKQIIATTLLQGQILTMAGLPDSTADMRWNKRVAMYGTPILEPLPPSEPPIKYEGVTEHPADYAPAWSIGKLIQIAGITLLTGNPRRLREYLVDFICQQLENGGGDHPQFKSGE